MTDDEKLAFDHTGQVDIELTQDLREENGREPVPDSPPPGKKYMAKQGLAGLKLNGPEFRVMYCLLCYARQHSGSCFPSETTIAEWTGLPLRTVERAIASLKAKGLIEVRHVWVSHTKRINRYFIQWEPLFQQFKRMKHFEAKAARQKVAGRPPSKVADSPPSKVAVEPRDMNLGSRNLGHIHGSPSGEPREKDHFDQVWEDIMKRRKA